MIPVSKNPIRAYPGGPRTELPFFNVPVNRDDSNQQDLAQRFPHEETVYLLFNSRLKTSGTNDNCTFILPSADALNKLYAPLTSALLAGIEIPNAMYPISSARQNNRLYFQEDGSTVTTYNITIPDNSYTGAQMATELATLLTAASGNAHTYTVAYDTQAKKLSVTTNGVSVKFVTGTNSAEDEVGFNVSQNFSVTYTGAYPVSLQGTNYVNVFISSLAHNNGSANQGSEPFERIPIDQPFGGIVCCVAQENHKLKVRFNDLVHLRLTLLDDKGLPLSLPANQYVSLRLLLTYTYF